MYCELLANAVRQIKGEPVETIPTATIDLGFAASIPKSYIPADRSRLDVYRRIAVAKTADELKQLESELADVYGPPPEEVKLLLDIAELRIAASKLDIKSIVAHGGNLVFSFPADAAKNAKRLLRNVAAKYTVADANNRLPASAEKLFRAANTIVISTQDIRSKKAMSKLPINHWLITACTRSVWPGWSWAISPSEKQQLDNFKVSTLKGLPGVAVSVKIVRDKPEHAFAVKGKRASGRGRDCPANRRGRGLAADAGRRAVYRVSQSVLSRQGRSELCDPRPVVAVADCHSGRGTRP